MLVFNFLFVIVVVIFNLLLASRDLHFRATVLCFSLGKKKSLGSPFGGAFFSVLI